MASQTKLIIIASSEDLIHQFFLNKATNTRIIDIDNDNQMTSRIDDNNNITDLAVFAGLSELNSSSDQVYKRALDSPDHSRSKPIKVARKSTDMVCVICGDRAIGFNYNVISCASCKAFFRRNAHQPFGKIQCLKGQGQCSVAYEVPRKCPRCRLNRCFAMGMRKDLIVSQKEKERKKKCLEENRNFTAQRLSTLESTNSLLNSESLSPVLDEIDHLLIDMDNVLHESSDSNEMEKTLFGTYSVEDWIAIQGVRSSFLSIFQSENIKCPFNDSLDHVSVFISWSQTVNHIALCFIRFCRQIDEFESLNSDDRFILIKYNLFCLFPIFKCFSYEPINDLWCSHEDNEEVQKTRRFFISCDQSVDIRDTFVNLVLSLVEVTEQDPTILSLLLTVLIFSKGLSMNEDEQPLKDPLAVNRVQCHYTKLLWNYLVNTWDEVEAFRRFTQLFFIIIRIQSAAKRTREFFSHQLMKTNTVDRIAPLMKTVLHIS